MSDRNPDTPKEVTRFKWEYKNFLEFVQKRKVSRAVIYAKSLGIDRKTLTHWMSQPELREALTDALDEIVEGMKTAGHKDWRMWRELYEMLGLDDVKNVDVTTNGNPIPTVIIDGVYGQQPNFRINNSTPEVDDLAENSSSSSS